MGVAVSNPAPRIAVAADKVTVIDCETDAMILPVMKTEMRERFAGSAIHVLGEGGHYPHILNSDAYTNIVRTALGGAVPEDFSTEGHQ